MRYGGKQTLYDVLDLPRGATSLEVEMAYRRMKAEYDKGDEPPDPRRMSLMREALEVLGDDRRRAAYDASLMHDPVAAPPHRYHASPRTVAIALGVIALLSAAIVLLLRPHSSASALRDQVAAQANVSVARLQAIDTAGRRSMLGFATAVEDGVMATTCHGITPGMQLVVNNGTLVFGATVAIADYAADVCKLSAAGGASRPVALTLPPPRGGERLYVVIAGEAGLMPQEVKALGTVAVRNGAAIEIDRAIAPAEDGAAVFDSQGKLAGIATSAGSTADGRGIVLPAAWITAARARPAPPR